MRWNYQTLSDQRQCIIIMIIITFFIKVDFSDLQQDFSVFVSSLCDSGCLVMQRSCSFSCVGNSEHSGGRWRGSLLIITAERAAQTTALYSHHDGHNTLHLTLNIFAVSIYLTFWLHSVYRMWFPDLEDTKSFVSNLKIWLESNRICLHAQYWHARPVCSVTLGLLFVFVRLCLSDICLHCIDTIMHMLSELKKKAIN